MWVVVLSLGFGVLSGEACSSFSGETSGESGFVRCISGRGETSGTYLTPCGSMSPWDIADSAVNLRGISQFEGEGFV